DGSYGVGTIIPIQVTFSKVVTVTGNATLTVETGATDAVAVYAGGSSTATFTFNYTVASGHSSPDLNYQSTAALVDSSGTIMDAFGNPAMLTLPDLDAAGSLAVNKDLVIDGIVP